MTKRALSVWHDWSVRCCSMGLCVAALCALYGGAVYSSVPPRRQPSPVASQQMVHHSLVVSASTPASDTDPRWSWSPQLNVAAGDAPVSVTAAASSAAVGAVARTVVPSPVSYIRFIDPLSGLGNKMFQYASSLGLALRHGCNARLVVDHDRIASTLASMRRAFTLTPLPVQDAAPPSSAAATLVESGWGHYDVEKFENRKTFASSVTVLGYLQSWKYFQPVASRIRQEFALTPKMIATVDSFFHEIGVARDELLVGVHVRRGDMVARPDLYTVAPPAFVKKAVDHYVAKYGGSHRLSFLFATNDRRWVDDFITHYLPRNLSVRHVSFSPEEDMAILSRCNHSVVTAGTYGWWSAWLAGGDVVYYKDFIRESSRLRAGYDPSDYYPPHWLGLAV